MTVTPYAQMITAGMRPEAQPTFAYEYQRYSKDPTIALALTLVLGVIGGESFYLGNYARAILMTIALFTGIGLFITVPMWIVRCFTIQNECESYNDYVAYMLASRYWSAGFNGAAVPPAPPSGPEPTRVRPNIGGVPMPTRVH
jgi:TM2 domain-containing membrane protein YozV